MFGAGVGFLWRSYETFAQISLRNQLLVANDWVRTKVFGRCEEASKEGGPGGTRGGGACAAARACVRDAGRAGGGFGGHRP